MIALLMHSSQNFAQKIDVTPSPDLAGIPMNDESDAYNCTTVFENTATSKARVLFQFNLLKSVCRDRLMY
jgi:hypothetical protein